ncbi:MAG: HAMP domain-containing sensor histidine kinase [Sphaerochaeta sp.]|jgi:two-component system sensor histidine kinase BaeS|nr:HAMP domain-containing sensor histidine kinase [Sphaerochaeta sp.]
MRKPFSLAALNLALVILSLLIFALVLSFFLSFGLDAAQASWHAKEEASLNAYIVAQLLDAQQPVTADTASTLFGSLPYAPTYLYVTDSLGQLLYSYRKAERGAGRGRGLQFGLVENLTWLEVKSGSGELLYRYAVNLPTFSEMEGNASLLAAAKRILIRALLIALIVSTLLAFLFLKPLKKQSRNLAQALDRMAGGERTVAVESKHVVEFELIANAARTLQETLKGEEKLRRQWAEDIAHDLRTPVSVLKGQLEAVGDKVLPFNEERLVLLQQETVRLQSLIDSLALLTKLESPDLVVHTSMIHLKPFLHTFVQRFEAEAAKRDMHIQLPSDDALLDADQQLFTRAMENLMSNAIKYGLEHSIVQVRFTSNAEKRAESLTIENEGTIEESYLPRLFDRLSRGEAGRSSQGSGLGLSIVKAIVQAHRWTIEVESNTTTTFTLRFT